MQIKLLNLTIMLGLVASTYLLKAEKNQYSKYFKEFKRPTGPIPGLDHKDPKLKARIELGKNLFFDPRISGSGWISCASCHNPGLGFEDGLDLGFGHGMKKLGRHTPTILNLAYNEADAFFWDGRAESLEEQALGPIEAGVEMNMSLEKLEKVVASIKGYENKFASAFGDKKVTKERIGKAIADFERTMVTGEAPFDRWIEGDDKAISESAKRGFQLFNEKANCAVCHSGWRFTDDGFHNIGVKSDDPGRFKVLELEVLKNAFKTPTLRNIAKRGPYLHNGSEATLDSVVHFYNRGGDTNLANKSPEVRPLGLNGQEMTDLVEFLHTLDSQGPQVTFPDLPQ